MVKEVKIAKLREWWSLSSTMHSFCPSKHILDWSTVALWGNGNIYFLTWAWCSGAPVLASWVMEKKCIIIKPQFPFFCNLEYCHAKKEKKILSAFAQFPVKRKEGSNPTILCCSFLHQWKKMQKNLFKYKDRKGSKSLFLHQNRTRCS